MASQQCVITIMNIIQVLWRTAPTVAVPARAREPENNAPTDLQEGYKIDKYLQNTHLSKPRGYRKSTQVYRHCMVQTTVRTT